MAAVSAKMVKELRVATGAGMMDCKKALSEAEGNFDKAAEILREKGIAKAAKKADRVAAEGAIVVQVAEDFAKATICEINSETDFVAKNDNFKALTAEASLFVHNNEVADVEALKAADINGAKFEEYMTAQTAKIGEKIDFRRFAKVCAEENGAVNAYVHSNGKVGVIVAAKADSADAAKGVIETLKDIAMHAAAMKPAYLNDSEIPAELLAKEEEIARTQLLNEGKPEAMLDKIIPGKIKKFIAENTLVGQKFVKDDKISVAQALSNAAKAAGGKADLVSMVRFELGEGIEKRADDFAAEVAAQLG